MHALRRAPAFAAAVVLTLSIGIAAVVTMFTVYWHVAVSPVRLIEPDRVVTILRERRDPQVPTTMSWPRVQAMRSRAGSFAALAAYSNESVSLTAPGALPRDLRALRVSAGFFDALRVAPARGRLLTAEDDVPNGPMVCVLSFEAWVSVFASADVVGRTILLSGRPTEVVGVMPPRLSPPWGDREIVLPRVFDDSQLTPAAVAAGASYLNVVARLAPGSSLASAADELRAVSREFARDNAGRSDTINDVEVVALAQTIVANRRPTLTLLVGAVVIVLLASCANAAALVVSRLASRRQELAVRAALGASRRRLGGLVLSESVILTLTAGLAALVLSLAALDGISATLGGVLPPGVDLRPSGTSALVAVGAMLCALLLSGLLPAWHATRRLGRGAATFARGMSETVGTHRFRRLLVTVEVALSAFLLVGAALFMASLYRTLRSPLGFEPAGVATASVTLPAERYATAEAQRAFFVSVLDRLRQTPQVESAAVAFGLPFGSNNFVSPYVIAGRPVPPPAERRRAGLRIVTEDYWRVMRVRLVAGRLLTAADRVGSHPVCVVNEALARREFGGASALGATVLRGRDADQPFEIVGVVADVRTNGPNAAVPDELFLPLRQVTRPTASIVVRTGSPEAAAPLLQSAVGAVDRDLPTAEFITMERALGTTLGPERILAGLTGVFAGVALLLAAIGVYAVVAHAVSARTVEIGIRMAVGADRPDIVRLIVLETMRLVATGTAIGLCAALAASRAVSAQLHEVSARDPRIYIVVAFVFALVGAAAALLPARRAARVDPVVCLTGR